MVTATKREKPTGAYRWSWLVLPTAWGIPMMGMDTGHLSSTVLV
jgi:hypothetical protein